MAHHKLTQKKVDGLSRPGRYSDRGGLYATVTETGGFWTFRYVRGGRDGKRGRERWMGLGPLWDVPLAEARDGAEQARKLVRQDIDPLDARRERRDAKALRGRQAHCLLDAHARFRARAGVGFSTFFLSSLAGRLTSAC